MASKTLYSDLSDKQLEKRLTVCRDELAALEQRLDAKRTEQRDLLYEAKEVRSWSVPTICGLVDLVRQRVYQLLDGHKPTRPVKVG